MAVYRAKALGEETYGDWESLNGQAQDGSFDHSLRWLTTLEKSIGHIPHCFLMYRDDEPMALCPLFKRSMKGFRGLATLPESDLYYMIVKDPSDTELIDAILQQVFVTAKQERSAFALLSFSSPELQEVFAARASRDHAVLPHHMNGYMSLDLAELSPQDIWEKVFSHKGSQRKYIRRFEQAGFKARDTRSEDDLRTFYEHYSHNLIQKGMNPVGISHFQYLFREFPEDELRMTLLEKDGRMAAGLITFLYPSNRTAYVRYSAPNKDGGSDSYFRRANLPLYWEFINHTYDRGYRRICFGSTRPDPNDRVNQIKTGLGCRYVKLYTSIIPTGRLFGTLYRAHKLIEEDRSE